MSETTNAPEQSGVDVASMSEEDQLSALTALIEQSETPARDAQAGTPTPGDDQGTAPGESQSSEKDDTGTEPALPPIEPPASWSKEDRAHFASLSREAQEIVSRREAERDTTVRRVQNEAADARKAAEAAEAKRLQQEQTYKQALVPALQELQSRMAQEFHPDTLAKLARENPAEWVVKTAERDRLLDRARAVQAEAERQSVAAIESSRKALVATFPEWKKAEDFTVAAARLRSYGLELGFTEADMDSAVDHRALTVLEKARRFDAAPGDQAEKARKWDELMERAKKAPAQRAAQPTPPARTISATRRTDPDTRATMQKSELLKIAKNGSADQQVKALASFFQ